MKILLTGRTGQVGHELGRSLQGLGEIVALDRSQMDLADLDQVRDVIRQIKPNLIVNPAAYTAVDKAESEPALASLINGQAPAVMAEEAQKLGAAMIHYSTDYVFDGSKSTPYSEQDTPNPQSVYGRTKQEGDAAVASLCQAHWIFRTSWVYGVHGGNFLKTILRLAQERDSLRIVADQAGAPTWARTIAKATADAMRAQSDVMAGIREKAGIYNLSASGSATWHAYATHIVKWAHDKGLPLKLAPEAIVPIATEEYPLPAPRPRNSRLLNQKIEQAFHLALPRWDQDLDSCLRELFPEA